LKPAKGKIEFSLLGHCKPILFVHGGYVNCRETIFQKGLDPDKFCFIWQCRYGGVEVPDHLWIQYTTSKGEKYSDNQAENMIAESEFMSAFDTWVKDFKSFVRQKGKVQPNKYRAFGYKPPKHIWASVKDCIRYFEMMVGIPLKGSSPKMQQELDLNKDVTWHTKKGEGRKLRDDD
jgi:hypothetical protein